ncbi:MAG TPA: DUF503 domain-containing protein [Anaerolineales bacterium]
MTVVALTLDLLLPGCTTLKDKRSRLKPLLLALRREFNVAVAEMDAQDNHRRAVLGLVSLGNDSAFVQRSLAAIPGWIEAHRPDLQIMDHRVELL